MDRGFTGEIFDLWGYRLGRCDVGELQGFACFSSFSVLGTVEGVAIILGAKTSRTGRHTRGSSFHHMLLALRRPFLRLGIIQGIVIAAFRQDQANGHGEVSKKSRGPRSFLHAALSKKDGDLHP